MYRQQPILTEPKVRLINLPVSRDGPVTSVYYSHRLSAAPRSNPIVNNFAIREPDEKELRKLIKEQNKSSAIIRSIREISVDNRAQPIPMREARNREITSSSASVSSRQFFYKEYTEKIVPRISSLIASRNPDIDPKSVMPIPDKLIRRVYATSISKPGTIIDGSIYGSLCALSLSLNSPKKIYHENDAANELVGWGITVPFEKKRYDTAADLSTLLLSAEDYLSGENYKDVVSEVIVYFTQKKSPVDIYFTSKSRINNIYKWIGNDIIRDQIRDADNTLSEQQIDEMIAKMSDTVISRKGKFLSDADVDKIIGKFTAQTSDAMVNAIQQNTDTVTTAIKNVRRAINEQGKRVQPVDQERDQERDRERDREQELMQNLRQEIGLDDTVDLDGDEVDNFIRTQDTALAREDPEELPQEQPPEPETQPETPQKAEGKKKKKKKKKTKSSNQPTEPGEPEQPEEPEPQPGEPEQQGEPEQPTEPEQPRTAKLYPANLEEFKFRIWLWGGKSNRNVKSGNWVFTAIKGIPDKKLFKVKGLRKTTIDRRSVTYVTVEGGEKKKNGEDREYELGESSIARFTPPNTTDKGIGVKLKDIAPFGGMDERKSMKAFYDEYLRNNVEPESDDDIPSVSALRRTGDGYDNEESYMYTGLTGGKLFSEIYNITDFDKIGTNLKNGQNLYLIQINSS